MAEVIDNVITQGLTGGISDRRYTFRTHKNGKTFLVRKPRRSDAEPTEAQTLAKQIFKLTTERVNADRADAEKWAEWTAKANASSSDKYSTPYGYAFHVYYQEVKAELEAQG